MSTFLGQAQTYLFINVTGLSKGEGNTSEKLWNY